jgi:hypothetical protein
VISFLKYLTTDRISYLKQNLPKEKLSQQKFLAGILESQNTSTTGSS